MQFDNDFDRITPESSTVLTINSTGALIIPIGTTAQRPASPTNGIIRYNSDLSFLEFYQSGEWVPQSPSTSVVRAASTANVTLTAPGASIDGVTLVAGDRVLLKNQTTTAQNGLYIWNGAAVAMTRPPDAAAWQQIVNKNVLIVSGTVNTGAVYLCTAANTGTIGTTAMPWTLLPSGGSTSMADGTVASPGWNFTNEPTTGFYRPSAGILAISTLGLANTRFINTTNAVNFLDIQNGPTGSPPTLIANGTDANIGIHLQIKGSAGKGLHVINSAGGDVYQVNVLDTTASTNYLVITNSGSAGVPDVTAAGAGTDIGMRWVSKGLGSFLFSNNSGATQFFVNTVANAVNYLSTSSGITGNSPSLQSVGSDTNLNLQLVPKGTGYLDVSGTSSIKVPTGTTAQRATSPVNGMVRYNSTTGFVELYQSNEWIAQINYSAVRVASTANVTLTAPGASIDGVTMAAGDRVLLKNQTTTAQNGLYIWNGAAVAMTRSPDASAWQQIYGRIIFVISGTTNANRLYASTASLTGTIDTTSITWALFTATVAPAGVDTQVQFNNAGGLGADSGLTYIIADKRLNIGVPSLSGLLTSLLVTNNSNGSFESSVHNTNGGNTSSTDIITYTDTSTSSTNFIDMGINTSTFNDATFSIAGALDGYLYTNGGHLTLGTETSLKDVVIFGGGTLAANEIGRFYNNGTTDRGLSFTDGSTISLPAFTTTTPTTPPANRVDIFNRQVAGRNFLAFIGSSGLDTSVQPFLARNKIAYATALGNATTVLSVLGLPALTVTGGTATARNVATTNIATRMKRLGYVSAATAAAIMTCTNIPNQYTSGTGTLGGFNFISRIVPSNAAAVSGERMFFGMRNGTAAFTNVEPNTLTNCIGLCSLSTSTNLFICYGGTVASTAIDLGVNFPGNTLSTEAYELAIFSPISPANTFNWQVTRLSTGAVASGTLTGTAGTNFPANTTLLSWQFFKTNNATALAVGLDICSTYLETDN